MVAIIGVLAAVAVPVFGGTLEKSRETVCLNNRIVLQRHLMYDLLSNEDMGESAVKEAFLRYQTEEGDNAKCPSGGTYGLSYTDTAVKGNVDLSSIGVSCDKHAPGGLTNQVAANNDYLKWLSGYLEDTSNRKDQQSVIDAYKKYLADQESALRSVPQEEVLALLPGDLPGFYNVSDKNPLVWVPLRIQVGSDYAEIMVITSESQAKQDPRKGFVFSYQGEYYWSGKTSYNGMCDYQNLHTPNNSYKSFEDFVTSKGWVKIDR